MKKNLLVLFLSLLLTQFLIGQDIIPIPNNYVEKAGNVSIPKKITISSTSEFKGLIPVFVESSKKFNIDFKEKRRRGFIRLAYNSSIVNEEAYKLSVSKSGILIEAGNANGAFYGLQSALQLVLNSGKSGKLAYSIINDTPRYGWRGVMVDESRHFIGKEEIIRLLDMMAFHKLNKFHWHLTDAQGWRIEIKQYPLLTTVGGKGNISDPDADVKFYTQEEITEIIEYAAERFIEVIPEIDMPGHATAAVTAYPEFSGGGSERYPHFTFNPGKEGTYAFLTNILREVAELFPSEYLHLGGDEVHFGNQQWNDLPEIKSLMKREGLDDLVAVEHYFLNRMADSVKTLNKTVVGWDELVVAGLSPENTVVMWWRHDRGDYLEHALNGGYRTILCPRIPLYLDFVQHEDHTSGRKWGGAFAPIELVHEFPSLNLTKGVEFSNPLVMGIQANVWTEVIDTSERFQFMVYPRLAAVAEAAWSNEDVKDFQNFDKRMDNMFDIYNKWGITFYDYRNHDNSKEILGPLPKGPIE